LESITIKSLGWHYGTQDEPTSQRKVGDGRANSPMACCFWGNSL